VRLALVVLVWGLVAISAFPGAAQASTFAGSSGSSGGFQGGFSAPLEVVSSVTAGDLGLSSDWPFSVSQLAPANYDAGKGTFDVLPAGALLDVEDLISDTDGSAAADVTVSSAMGLFDANSELGWAYAVRTTGGFTCLVTERLTGSCQSGMAPFMLVTSTEASDPLATIVYGFAGASAQHVDFILRGGVRLRAAVTQGAFEAALPQGTTFQDVVAVVIRSPASGDVVINLP
jgi:hypothetical protein